MRAPRAKQRFVVLDRDGTIIVERNYLSRPEQVELVPGAAAGLGRLLEMGLGLVVVTNQSGIGRKYFSREHVGLIHARMVKLLDEKGVRFEGIYVCPHTPEDGCVCRKPKPGLVRQAAAELRFNAAESIFVGDKQCDIELGQACGGTTLLVKTGYGAQHLAAGLVHADLIAEDLEDAAALIARRLASEKHGSER